MTVSALAALAPETGACIVGVGAAQPSRVVTGKELAEPFGKTAEWLCARTGIKQLRRLAPGEQILDLAITAACGALTDAGVRPDEVDAILVATCSQSPAGRPSLSSLVAARIAPRAVAFDVNAACAGFCYALSTAGDMIKTGSARTVLVVGAEQMSALIDPADLGTSILFGDGAGAVVVSARAEDGIGPAAWSSDGAQVDVLAIPAGETALRMQGQSVFRWAVEEVHKVAAAAMAKAGITAGEIDVFVPHQANLRIIEAIIRKLGLHHAITATDVTESGNTSGASIPIALAKLRSSGRTKPGQLALFAGFGAGLSIAAQVVRLP